MLESLVANPLLQGEVPTLIQTFSGILFCSVFLFLWRQSGVIYFRFWSLAWAVESLALISNFAMYRTGWVVFVWLRALLEFAFALSLLVAAQSVASPTARGSRSAMRSMLMVSGLMLLDYLFLWRLPLPRFDGLHSMILALIYGYSFVRIGMGTTLKKGIGGKMFRFTLACLCAQNLFRGSEYFYNVSAAGALWTGLLRWTSVYDVGAQTLLAFSAMAMWIQTQQDTIASLRVDLDAHQKSSAGSAELDYLTGLRNRLSLERHLDEHFTGVVAVCDLDYFKEINDRFGHLVGDDVLRGVGQLILKSIRAEDEAFRWGGDEFVVLFRNQRTDIVQGRMAALEVRLTAFGIRGHGQYPLGLSWGTAEGIDGVLRPVLQQADLQMYEYKRRSHAKGQST